jgi:hypothetical protein
MIGFGNGCEALLDEPPRESARAPQMTNKSDVLFPARKKLRSGEVVRVNREAPLTTGHGKPLSDLLLFAE